MKKILFAIFTGFLCVSVSAQSSADLRLKPEKNRVYRIRSVAEQTITQTINGNPQITESEVTYSLSLKMIDATSEFIVAEVRLDTMVTHTNTMGRESTVSSMNEGNIRSSESSDIVTCIMNRLSRNPLFVKMEYTGRPVEIVNLKMLSGMILKDTSEITLKGVMRGAVMDQIAGMLSENSLKTTIGMFTWCLPGRTVSAGDNWEVLQKTNTGGMVLDISTSYRLDAINGNYAEVTVESGIRAAENAAPIKSGGAEVTYNDLRGVSKSKLRIDLTTGLVAEDDAKTKISGNLNITAPGFSMQMPMDINGETRVTFIK